MEENFNPFSEEIFVGIPARNIVMLINYKKIKQNQY